MRKVITWTLSAGFIASLFACSASVEESARRLSVREYRDKMKAGWIGQIIGVSWGAPTEGKYRQIMPEDKMPPYKEDLVNNAFGQDDLYVEMTFLRSMEQYGLEVAIRQAGIDFANSEYGLWVANDAGRSNLRSGIAPPDSSHPTFHNCPAAIDYQIEADYSGLIAPGMPDMVIALGEKSGRLMNYGDGMYAGQFMGGMYAEAFFESDVVKIIEAGLKCIPAESQYAEMVRDMLQWHREDPAHWEKTWELVDKKYRQDSKYHLPPLDAKVEGAYVLMGLLYGGSDPDKTIIISCRCGSDSDCNPSSSGGVLFTAMGVSKLSERYYKALDETKVFSYTAYNFPNLLNACEKLARQSVLKAGGRIEKDASGEEVFVIPAKAPKPSKFENLHKPGPTAGSRFTDEEMGRIHILTLEWALPKLLPGWRASNCDMRRSLLLRESQGKKSVLTLLAPEKKDSDGICKLATDLEIPAGAKRSLQFSARRLQANAWDLLVKADGKEILRKAIPEQGWTDLEVDLSDFAGKKILLEIVAQPPATDAKKGTGFCLTAPRVEGKQP